METKKPTPDADNESNLSVFPIRAPDGSEIPEPTAQRMKRHLWVYGPPGTHKTLWFQTQVLKCCPNKCINGCFPVGKYRGEEIIYWDDTVPHLNRLLHCCGIPGILAIVISTKSINDTFVGQTREKVHERFIEYDMDLEVNQNFPKPGPL